MEIKIDGYKLDTESGGLDWVLELSNPMMSFDEVKGSRVYDITLPDTPTNRRYLGNVQHPAVRSAPKLIQMELCQGDATVEKGFGIIRDATEGFKISFTANLDEFFGQNQSKSLQELALATITAPGSWASTLSNTWSSGGYVLPTISSEQYWESGNIPGGFTSLINEFVSSNYTSNVKVPMFFVKYILKAVGDLSGITYAGDWYNSALADKLLAYNSRAVSGNFEVRKHLPAMSIAQLLLGLRQMYNVVLRFNSSSKRCRIDWGDTLIASAPVLDWSSRFPRITAGTPIWSDGIKLTHATDSGDGTSKDAFFLPYVSAGSGLNLGTRDISSPFSGFTQPSSLPTILQPGIATGQLDKSYGNRLLYWVGGSTPAASNSYGGVALNPAGIAPAYWAKYEAFIKSTYKVQLPAALTSLDITKMSSIFRGDDPAAPIVHVWGNNWLIDSISVPSTPGATSTVTMYRL